MTDWKDTAPCRGATALFFGPFAERPEAQQRRVARAIAVCNTCPHRQPCADYAETHRIDHGIWGGRLVEKPKRRPQPIVKDAAYYRAYRLRQKAMTA